MLSSSRLRLVRLVRRYPPELGAELPGPAIGGHSRDAATQPAVRAVCGVTLPAMGEHRVTGVDHVGIAVPDLDEAIELVRLDVRAGRHAHGDQRGAGRARGDAVRPGRLRGGRPAAGPAAPGLADRTFLDRSGPGIQQLAYRVVDIEAAAPRCANGACGCSTTSPAAAPPDRGSTSCTPRTPAACSSSWSSRRGPTVEPGLSGSARHSSRSGRYQRLPYCAVTFGIPRNVTGPEAAVQEILDAILADEHGAIGGLAVPDHYRGITVHADEVDMFAGHPVPGQGPAQEPAPRRGADPGARPRARRSSP